MFMLQNLRRESGMTRAELARTLNINQGTLANYEKHTREASYDMLIMFADFFDVSVDYLLGREDGAPKTDSKKAPYSFEEKRIIDFYRSLDSKQKKLFFEYCKILSESFSEKPKDLT